MDSRNFIKKKQQDLTRGSGKGRRGRASEESRERQVRNVLHAGGSEKSEPFSRGTASPPRAAAEPRRPARRRSTLLNPHAGSASDPLVLGGCVWGDRVHPRWADVNCEPFSFAGKIYAGPRDNGQMRRCTEGFQREEGAVRIRR